MSKEDTDAVIGVINGVLDFIHNRYGKIMFRRFVEYGRHHVMEFSVNLYSYELTKSGKSKYVGFYVKPKRGSFGYSTGRYRTGPIYYVLNDLVIILLLACNWAYSCNSYDIFSSKRYDYDLFFNMGHTGIFTRVLRREDIWRINNDC